ncbi:MAG: hypothetical protein ACYDDO_07490 [Acidiferrobacterales bacterium]
MTFVRGIAALLAIVLLAAIAHADDRIWIIGGGPDPEYSQAQIESNVIWAQRVIGSMPGRHVVRVYFGSGAAGGKDVREWSAPAETASSMQILARVFDSYSLNGDSFRHNRVLHDAGSTDALQLKKQLARDFRKVHPGDHVLIVFNGHGAEGRGDFAENSLELWNDTSLSVRDFAGVLSGINPTVPVRFVFTQCYSGGFARLIYRNVRARGALAPYQRCGFMAAAEDRTAEGCSAGINARDYRDYSTYFFAALAGHTRDGKPLPNNPDINGDGVVSLYEAHLYSLRNAHSTDIPRSTSEEYLERWLPWYLKWTLSYGPLPRAPGNPYWTLSDELAQAAGLGQDTGKWDGEIREREQGYRRRAGRIDAEQVTLARRIAALQIEIRRDMDQRWPEAEQPYTQAYRRFLDHNLAAAENFVVRLPSYAALVQEEQRYDRLDDEGLGVARDEAGMERISHIERLARLRDRFMASAAPASKAAYQRLLSCEQQGL